jgi:tRNA (cytidine/uridine-2'-O-)-methyltransferase
VALLAVALYHPEIPQNTGNVARTCAATRTPLHLIEPLGFQLADRRLKRAGLDYWPQVELTLHASWDAFRASLAHRRMIFFSSRGGCLLHRFLFRPGDCLVFGPETRGLPPALLAAHPDRVVSVPMDRTRVRSLNLATAVGIGLYEALRQLKAPEGDESWQRFQGEPQ